MKLLNTLDFNKLTNQQKRVEIAKDVLLRIKINIIIPTEGTFWYDRPEEEDHVGTPQEFFNREECGLCAKGALMCSWVGNFNNASWKDVMDYGESHPFQKYPVELMEIFGREMLDHLEAAFEGTTYAWHYSRSACDLYAYGFEEDRSLETLMQNIIDNGGELVVPPAPVEELPLEESVIVEVFSSSPPNA